MFTGHRPLKLLEGFNFIHTPQFFLSGRHDFVHCKAYRNLRTSNTEKQRCKPRLEFSILCLREHRYHQATMDFYVAVL